MRIRTLKGRTQFKRDRLRKRNSLRWLFACNKENRLIERRLNLKIVSGYPIKEKMTT